MKNINKEDSAIQEIRDFRKKRRDLQQNPTPPELDPEKIRIKNTVDEFMKQMVPSYQKLQESIENAADSAWYAMEELERFDKHIHEVHAGSFDKCEECCSKIWSRQDLDEFLKTIMKEIGIDLNGELHG